MHDFNHNGEEDSLDAFIENELSIADKKSTDIPRRRENQITQEEKLAREIIKTVLYILLWILLFHYL